MLELEDPRVVLVVGVLVGDQLDITARLRTDQGRPWPLPDERPVVRITHPQWRRSRLVAQLGMPLPLGMTAGLHVPTSQRHEDHSNACTTMDPRWGRSLLYAPSSDSSRSTGTTHRAWSRLSTGVSGGRASSAPGGSVTTTGDGWQTSSTRCSTSGAWVSTCRPCRRSASAWSSCELAWLCHGFFPSSRAQLVP